MTVTSPFDPVAAPAVAEEAEEPAPGDRRRALSPEPNGHSGGSSSVVRCCCSSASGIYRFWLATDIRRFLWSNTEVAGDGLEYIGTARELLLGFLIAIALLIPINGLFFLGAFAGASSRNCPAWPRSRRWPCLASLRSTARGVTASPARSIAVSASIRPDRRGVYAVCALFWWGMMGVDGRARLSVRAGKPRALQGRTHLLWRVARPLRGVTVRPVLARPADVDRRDCAISVRHCDGGGRRRLERRRGGDAAWAATRRWRGWRRPGSSRHSSSPC